MIGNILGLLRQNFGEQIYKLNTVNINLEKISN